MNGEKVLWCCHVSGEDAGDEPEPRVLEGHELGVGHERVVRLVSERRPGDNVIKLFMAGSNKQECLSLASLV